MNKAEIEARIEELEDKRFILSMKDRWSFEDHNTDNKWWRELMQLKKELAALS